MIDFAGHVGYLFITLGMLLIARRKSVGWLVRLTGELIWVGIGFALDLTSIWSWGFLFVCIDVAAFYSWRREA